MCYSFKEVALSVCEVIHRVSLPCVTGTVVRSFYHTVDNRVAEVHVRVGHVNLGTQYHLAFFNFSGIHFLEQFQAFLNRAVTIRTFRSRLGRSTFLGCNFFRGLFVYIRLSFFDKTDSEVPELLEIVGSIIFISPLEAQPLDVFLNGFYIFYIFFRRVCIIETQVTGSSVSLCDSEVQTNGFCMSDVQVSVRLWRETGLNSSTVFTFLQVFLYNLLNEIQAFLF